MSKKILESFKILLTIDWWFLLVNNILKSGKLNKILQIQIQHSRFLIMFLSNLIANIIDINFIKCYTFILTIWFSCTACTELLTANH